MLTFGCKLRELRKKTKMTLQEFGEVLGVSVNSVYRWEHDKSYPRKYMLEAMAKYYNVTIEWLLSDNTVASLVSKDEDELLNRLRKIPKDDINKVRGYLDSMVDGKV